jgi:hypothetical protein
LHLAGHDFAFAIHLPQSALGFGLRSGHDVDVGHPLTGAGPDAETESKHCVPSESQTAPRISHCGLCPQALGGADGYDKSIISPKPKSTMKYARHGAGATLSGATR